MAKESSGNAEKNHHTKARKRAMILLAVLVGLVLILSAHEVAVQYFPEITCVACHEMKDPVQRWRESGVAKNHKPIEQTAVHSKLMRFSNEQPCKDCHNHEMRNDQKFYERVLPEKEEPPPEQHAMR